MSAQDYYDPPQQRRPSDMFPPLPAVPLSNATRSWSRPDVSHIEPDPYEEDAYQQRRGRSAELHDPDDYYRGVSGLRERDDSPFIADDDGIPLRQQQRFQDQNTEHGHGGADREADHEHLVEQSRAAHPFSDMTTVKKRRAFFNSKTPWVVYTLTVAQIGVFIGEIIRNSILTGSPIEIHPSFNPMIGPSFYVLINMGARYVPCMRNQPGIQDAADLIPWPCPNTTSLTGPTCSLSELCGFGGVPNPRAGGSLNDTPAPNQWFRFVVPIFLHAGLIHIGFNMLLQLLLGKDIERLIGPVRFTLVYFAAGIFGFILGGNFAPAGTASTGASGALYGIIALTLLDLFYTWSTRPSPWRDLLFVLLDIVISFVIGLLPGVDNFSHIGGFLMGLCFGVLLLRSPQALQARLDYGADPLVANTSLHHPDAFHRQKQATAAPAAVALDAGGMRTFFSSPRDFVSNRKRVWWGWLLLRAGALAGAVVVFIVLLNNFYVGHDECCWCRYLSCLPIKNWCDVGTLAYANGTSLSGSNGTCGSWG